MNLTWEPNSLVILLREVTMIEGAVNRRSGWCVISCLCSSRLLLVKLVHLATFVWLLLLQSFLTRYLDLDCAPAIQSIVITMVKVWLSASGNMHSNIVWCCLFQNAMTSKHLKMAMLEQERAKENVLKRLEEQVVCVYVPFLSYSIVLLFQNNVFVKVLTYVNCSKRKRIF